MRIIKRNYLFILSVSNTWFFTGSCCDLGFLWALQIPPTAKVTKGRLNLAPLIHTHVCVCGVCL